MLGHGPACPSISNPPLFDYPPGQIHGRTSMHSSIRIFLGTVALAGIAAVAYGQGMAPSGPSMADVSIKDPAGPVPNPANIPFIPPEKLKAMFEGNGEQQIKLFGDASKPGM